MIRERGNKVKRIKVMYLSSMEKYKNGTAHVHRASRSGLCAHGKKKMLPRRGIELILSLEAREFLFTSNVRSLFCLCA